MTNIKTKHMSPNKVIYFYEINIQIWMEAGGEKKKKNERLLRHFLFTQKIHLLGFFPSYAENA